MVIVPGETVSEFGIGLGLSPPRVARTIPPVAAAPPTSPIIIHFLDFDRLALRSEATRSREFDCAMIDVAVRPFEVAVTLMLKRPVSSFGRSPVAAACPWLFVLV